MKQQRLQLLLEEIQININELEKGIAESENQYRELLKLVTDSDRRSSLMERHVVHAERQRTALSQMETLFGQVKNQLKD